MTYDPQIADLERAALEERVRELEGHVAGLEAMLMERTEERERALDLIAKAMHAHDALEKALHAERAAMLEQRQRVGDLKLLLRRAWAATRIEDDDRRSSLDAEIEEALQR